MPEYVNDEWKSRHLLRLRDLRSACPVHGGIIPGFEYKVIEEDERTRTIIDGDGATKMIQKDGSSTIPKYLKFPIETREDWEEFKKRLDPTDPRALSREQDWQNWKKSVEDQRQTCCASAAAACSAGSATGWASRTSRWRAWTTRRGSRR